PNPTQKPIMPLSLKIILAVSPTCSLCPSPTAPPTCIRRRITSSGYADVWDTIPATPPANSSAQLRNGTRLFAGALGGCGSVVYDAIAGCRSKSPAVSCVRNDIPAYGNIPIIVAENPL